MSDVIALAKDLIRRPSVTPLDEGCQTLMAERLERLRALHAFQTLLHLRLDRLEVVGHRPRAFPFPNKKPPLSTVAQGRMSPRYHLD